MTLHVACAADERYAPYCAAMLLSLLRQHRHVQVVVHYLHPPEFAADARQRFVRLVEGHGAGLAFHGVSDERVAGLPAMRSIERIVWYRIFLPQLLPDVDRVVYLDADTFIVDRLDPLLDLALDDAPLAAVRNVMKTRMREYLAERGLPVQAPYFNSGVMLMDLAAWRRMDATAQLVEIGRRHRDRYVFGDQDALNALFQSRCHWLHPRWNCQNSFDYWEDDAREVFGGARLDEARHRPAILHFEGPEIFKPWHYLSQHRCKPDYWRHLRQTGFPVPKLQGVTLRNVVHKHTRWIPAPVRARLRTLALAAAPALNRQGS